MILEDKKTFFSGSIENFKMKGNGIQMVISDDKDKEEFEFTKGLWNNNGECSKSTHLKCTLTKEEKEKVKSKFKECKEEMETFSKDIEDFRKASTYELD